MSCGNFEKFYLAFGAYKWFLYFSIVFSWQSSMCYGEGVMSRYFYADRPVTFLLQHPPEIVVKLFKSNKVSRIMKHKVPITCKFLHFFHGFDYYSVLVGF